MSDTEDSRAASLGRKRRQNTDAIQSAHDAEERRKLDNNADFVALDSDDNSETVSHDRESGELSDAADTAEHSFDKPHALQNNAAAVQSAQHPLRAPSPTPPPNNIPLEAVFPQKLQNFVKVQLQQHPNKTVENVLSDNSEEGRPFLKNVKAFLKDWNSGYATHLKGWDYHQLQQTLEDPEPFRISFRLPAKTKSNLVNALDKEVQKAPEKPRAAAAFELTKSQPFHVRMSDLLGKYLKEQLLPNYKRKTGLNRDSRLANNGDGGAANAAPVNGANTNTAFRNDVRLEELTPEEVQEQTRYFGISAATDLVRCLSCGDRGHMKKSCPANHCLHCNSTSHFSRVCPSHQKCRRCRQRGHRDDQCSRSSREAGLFGDECDVCGKLGHAEEECAGIWQTFNPDKPDRHKRIAEDQMAVSCYNCGRTSHWGDDCPALPDFVADVIYFDTWSKKNADRYVMKAGEEDRVHGNVNGQYESHDDDDAASVGQDKGDGREGMPAHQVAMLGEWA